jgi:WS/DGAT/MGAT family acyltransferase
VDAPGLAVIDRLTAEDQVMLAASDAWPQDIGVLAVIDGTRLVDATGRLQLDRIRALVESRLHRVHRFRQVIRTPRRWLGPPLWVDVPTIDLRQHVRELSLEAGADERSLLVAVERLRSRPLDPGRPRWEMWFLTGLPHRRVGLFVKIHHAVADGLAAMEILKAFFDRSPAAANGPWVIRTPEPMPSTCALLLDNAARQFGGIARTIAGLLQLRRTAERLHTAWPAVRELLADRPGPRTSLDRVIGPARLTAVVRAPYLQVRRIGRAEGASVNDVLLAITAGGLRALLQSRGESVDGLAMRIFVPVTLRHQLHATESGTQIAQMVVPLPVGEADPRRRLRRITAETTRRKGRVRTSLGSLFGGRLVRGLLLKAVIRQRVNVASTSIPGPARPLFFAGARVLEVVPLIALIGNVPLGIAAVSYAGEWRIGIVADRDAVPDLQVFVDGVREDLRALSGEAAAIVAA